jgi:hypothetical protein
VREKKLCGQNKDTVKVKQAPKKVTVLQMRGNHMGKEDKTPNLGPFTGNPGMKRIASDPRKVSEIIELFFGDNFFEMLCKETNLYYFHNEGNYDSSSKGLKFVDISIAEMKKFFAIIILMWQVRKDKVKDPVINPKLCL